ncbi:MAG: hypothetical protein PSV23_16180 [Brevundimonas sp.]|uniref:hypothetical protein n=1 Tax=Brevundimonas sp. TaxID=1871086 RepID=UPI00248A2324|nr:hypothetical protein [Brevundimonas sp.]MDI1328330.1 hypothetical protein [Brevundimonas sp.]
MTAERSIEVHALHWRGVDIEITFERDWLSIAREHDLAASHLTVTALQPKRARLPITETGYRSHFLHFEDVDQAGGPATYVEAWLDQMAQSREWIDYEESSRQLSLF